MQLRGYWQFDSQKHVQQIDPVQWLQGGSSLPLSASAALSVHTIILNLFLTALSASPSP